MDFKLPKGNVSLGNFFVLSLGSYRFIIIAINV